jgi:hypothetical protein
MMKVTYHAAQRFLERVVHKSEFTKKEVQTTIDYLTNIFKDVVVNSYSKPFALPGFEKQYYVVHRDNSILTIIPKDEIFRQKQKCHISRTKSVYSEKYNCIQ